MPRIPPRRKAAKPPCNKSPLRPALCLLTSRHGSFFRHQALQADTCIQEGIPGMNHTKEDIKRQIIKLDVDPSLRTEVRKIMIRDGIRQGVFIPRPPLQNELLVHLPQCCCAGHLYPHQRPLRAWQSQNYQFPPPDWRNLVWVGSRSNWRGLLPRRFSKTPCESLSNSIARVGSAMPSCRTKQT